MAAGDDDRLLPEQRARVRIDDMLKRAGWMVQDYNAGTSVPPSQRTGR